jgi:AcrR family transcriptional regulator
MPAVKRRARKPRVVEDARLTRARIVETGLALLAERGADGLNMRSLADALGAAPMSLYRHVRSKEDLLKAIVAMVLERHDFALPARGQWTERVAAWMHALRAQLLRSPAVVSVLMQHGHYAPALLRATNVLLRLLREAGFDGPDAVRASREIMWSTLGFVSAEIRGPTFSPSFYAQALHEQAGDGADLAEVAAHMPHLLTRDLDDVFAAIVRHLLAGLAADLAERAAPARRSGRA